MKYDVFLFIEYDVFLFIDFFGHERGGDVGEVVLFRVRVIEEKGK